MTRWRDGPRRGGYDRERPTLMPKARIAKDLTVSLQQDRPGMLARAAEAIAAGGLNIDGFAEVEGILHLLTADPASASRALESVGLRASGEQEVVILPLEDRPGAAARVFTRLAEAGLNVAYTYIASGNRLVVATADPARTLEALRD